MVEILSNINALKPLTKSSLIGQICKLNYTQNPILARGTSIKMGCPLIIKNIQNENIPKVYRIFTLIISFHSLLNSSTLNVLNSNMFSRNCLYNHLNMGSDIII